MASARDLAVKRGETVLYFNPSQLILDPKLNIRDLSTADNQEHVKWLMDEILEKGFTSILRVLKTENDEIVVTEGHCRRTAVKNLVKAGKLPKDIGLPCLVEAQGTSLLDLYARQFSTNGTSKGLNADEAAANIKRIMTFGKTQAEVARIIGKSAQYVSQMLGFQEAPSEVREMVAKGEISTSAAMATLRKEGPSKGAEKLKAGVTKAKASGRTKATAKDIESKVKAKSDTAIIIDRRLAAQIVKALRDAEEDVLVEKLEAAIRE